MRTPRQVRKLCFDVVIDIVVVVVAVVVRSETDGCRSVRIHPNLRKAAFVELGMVVKTEMHGKKMIPVDGYKGIARQSP